MINVDAGVHASSPVGNAFGISVDALVRAVAANASRHGVGDFAGRAVRRIETLHAVPLAIADTIPTGHARSHRRLAGIAVGTDAGEARTQRGRIGVVELAGDTATTVADTALTISGYLGCDWHACRGVRKSAGSVEARSILAVGIGSRTVSGGRALRCGGSADAVRACLAARAVFRLLALGYSRGAGSIDAGLPGTALMTATAAVL